MRRSAAPSQVLGSAAKKPRFIPPGKSNTACLKSETEELDPEKKLKEVDKKRGSAPGHARTLSKIHFENQNINFTQSVESNVEVKTRKPSNGLGKPRTLEMKTLNLPKAEEYQGQLTLIQSDTKQSWDTQNNGKLPVKWKSCWPCVDNPNYPE